MSSRSERRHHTRRLKAKNRKILGRVIEWRPITEKDVGKATNHQIGCSCPLCGNPRKWRGEKTRQEIRSEQEYK
ncbi:MAG: hypothetical protein KAS32_27780 [Candidatus Peribacteraceae bacterium]|nr:hypothetical protein [Candidatus Peribacteraceae bacterium]